MKRYMLFAGEACYPDGGWQDFVGDSDAVETLKELCKNHLDRDLAWAHIVDCEAAEVVCHITKGVSKGGTWESGPGEKMWS